MFAHVAGRFLYPARPASRRWTFVAEVSRLKPGESLIYRMPAGASVAVARVGQTGTAEDFLALGSTCPHLGCQVHWEAQNNRFFCPCHNGVFEPSGRAIGGPPGEAGQSLPRYPLKVEKGLLYIEVPADAVAEGEGGVELPGGLRSPGHGPRLAVCGDSSARADGVV
jgi:cytochrome b6-f complex iron-sulfur subunit